VQRVHRHSTRLFGVLMVLIGVAMVITAIVTGGGPASLGVVLGVMFAALGAARFHLAGHTRAER
jgi:drug/metabolite transporter (DMT)-like permease